MKLFMNHLLLLSLLVASTLGQTTKVASSFPEGTIQGSQHPELISDDVAWRMFIVINASILQKNPSLFTRHKAQWLRDGIPQEDVTTLETSLARFQQINKGLEDGINDSLSTPEQKVTMTHRREKQIAQERVELQSFITSVGLQALNKHLQWFKSTLFVIPPPALPKGARVPVGSE